MYLSTIGAVLSAACLAVPISAQQLFAAHSDGNVSTLALTKSSGGNTSFTLTVTSRTPDCGPNAATLNLDYSNRILYCLDRGRGSATAGSLNSFSIDEDGNLTRIARVSAPLSGVAAEIFTAPGGGARGYVSGHYNKSAIGVYRLGEDGALTEPLQTIFPNTSAIGPVPARQDASYLHHVILDPKREFILTPDLGQDRIRVWSYNRQNIAPLVELPPLITEPGCGPRHAVFWKSPETSKLHLFFNCEISQKIFSYIVEYRGKGLAWDSPFSIAAISDSLPAATSPTSEIAITPDGKFVIVSNRDVSFAASTIKGPNTDTLSTFSINGDGSLELVQLAPSGGFSPRQFMINKAGDKIAVGHQNDNTVVVWERDVKSGKILTEAEGGKLGVVTLSGAVVFAQWDE